MAHSEAFLKLVNESRSRIKEFTVDEIYQRQEKGETFHLVDCREESEWAKDHIRGSIYIGKGVIERDIESRIPDKNADVVIYCGGGFRSAIAADLVQRMGYSKVSSMDGGIREWKEKGYPLES